MSRILAKSYWWMVNRPNGKEAGHGQSTRKRSAERDANKMAKQMGVGAYREIRGDGKKGGLILQGTVIRNARGRLEIDEEET